MTAGLENKKVVVIGGTSGIGLALARAAQGEGASVVVASSKPAKVEAAVAGRGEGARGEALDVTREADVAAFFQRLGALDHLVFTAGDWTGARFGPLAELDVAAAADRLGVRFWGALAAAKHAAGVIAADGSITLTGGMLAHRPTKGSVLATAFGGAIEHLALALAVELAPVRVNAVCPGLVLTDATASLPAEAVRRFTANLPLPRAAAPEEVAQAYLYLMRGGYTTGQVLRVDGGGSAI
ncbi:MAG: SDR family oxidoreductase [Caulobacteraceae bacterium]